MTYIRENMLQALIMWLTHFSNNFLYPLLHFCILFLHAQDFEPASPAQPFLLEPAAREPLCHRFIISSTPASRVCRLWWDIS
jgi:hypothetical protein